MTEEPHSIVMASLKQAEPMAVLASLSIVISVFTFDKQGDFQNIYNYSTTATFMFILSFIFSTLSNLLYIRGSNAEFEQIRMILMKLGAYFFLSIGVLYFVLIAYEFGLKDSKIFDFVKAFVFLFFLASNVIMYKWSIRKKSLFFVGKKKWALYINKISYGLGIASAAAFFLDSLIFAFKSKHMIPDSLQVTLLLLMAMPYSIMFIISSIGGTSKVKRDAK